jgi:hypothetical protein
MHAAVSHFESQRLVRSNGSFIVDQRIGSHLKAAALPRPDLRCGDQ